MTRDCNPLSANRKYGGRVAFCPAKVIPGCWPHANKLTFVWIRVSTDRPICPKRSQAAALCHEFCHHLDFHRFAYGDSWHTRGFYERTATLYHHARGTPRKPLVWLPAGGRRWRIDWSRMK